MKYAYRKTSLRKHYCSVGVDALSRWDLIIVGGGVAGLTAGIYGSRSGLETLILEENVPGGQAAYAPIIENYPGFPEGINGMELISRIIKQAERMGVEIHQLEKVTSLHVEAAKKQVITDKAVYEAVKSIVKILSKGLGVPKHDAYMIASLTVDFKISQVVDPLKTVRAVVPKNILSLEKVFEAYLQE